MSPAAAGFGADLARRVATAAVALPALAAALFLGPPALFVAIAAFSLLLGLRELFALARARGLAPLKPAGLLVTAAAFVEVAYPHWPLPPLLPAAVLLVAAAALRRGGDLGTAVASAAVTFFGAAYLGGLGGTIAALRVLEPAKDGAWRVVLLLAVIMVADTFALFAGRALGRRRLAAAISPDKTVEGAIGGLLGGVVAALVVRRLGLPALPLRDAVALGLLVSGAGTVGDLFESLLKRWAGVKDSGALFPGHGGMLDRLDSLLFGGPVLYYYFFCAR